MNINIRLNLYCFLFYRWFTVQGWSSGPYPINIPHSLSMALQDLSEVPSGTTAATRTTNWDNNSKKEMRSVFDLVAHLCGRSVPGIPLTSALPTNPTERTRQIHWMYSTFITFLRTQGAMLSGVKPEYLLAPEDYRIWRKIQKKTDPNEILDDETKQKQLKEERRNLARFGSVSTKSWTDVLAQIIKVYRITGFESYIGCFCLSEQRNADRQHCAGFSFLSPHHLEQVFPSPPLPSSPSHMTNIIYSPFPSHFFAVSQHVIE